MIGFTGASRTGKSTLARAAGEALGLPYFEMKTAEIMKAAGYENIGNLPIEERLAAQDAYLKAYGEILGSLDRPTIVDRTPIDLIGYMMAEVGMHATTPEQGERIRDYCERALTMANRNFAMIFVPCPLPTYEMAEGKAPPNRAYQWHTHWIMEGAMQMLRGPMSIRVSTTDPDKRLQGVCEVIADWLTENAKKRASSSLH
ncbi:AAA family ATPase [Methylorubrum extorquens]|uniref:AAA family ATPase n=1 Tax=Methylorubrum extorquens TaxID=408 RepID=UPI0020A00223|nr:AAA family ATPase [Methylorubrum extorquens]MCP1539983.1 hypothetical protein [Methylorubrum extorquens]